MTMKNKKYTREWLVGLDLQSQVEIWNNYCYECEETDKLVYDNNQSELEFCFDGNYALLDLAQAIHFGSYDYYDKYFVLDKKKYIWTFSYAQDFYTRIDVVELLEWLNESEEE